jgi:hypothetical protein
MKLRSLVCFKGKIFWWNSWWHDNSTNILNATGILKDMKEKYSKYQNYCKSYALSRQEQMNILSKYLENLKVDEIFHTCLSYW